MKKSFVVFGCLYFFCVPFIHAQFPALQQKAIILKRVIERNHVSPRCVDDSFSVTMLKSILRMTDRRRLFFTDAEYKVLSAFQAKLDDELNGKSWAFYDLFESLYKKAVIRADSIVNKLLQTPFDFAISESITVSREETFNFSTDLTTLSGRWSRYLKYKILDQLYDIAAADSSGKTTLKAVIPVAEAKVRERTRIAEGRTLKKILDHSAGFSNYVAQLYLNAIAMGFDPHTGYFSTEDKDAFKRSLSTESLSFGFELDENEKGGIIIDKLLPGGAAWKSGDLNEGDEVLSLQWEGKNVVELTELTLEDAYGILEQSENDRLVLKFRKKDGTTGMVFLQKEKIEREENVVKGFLLKGEKKIGYILLPAFYTKWENESGSSCANDVAKEIVKLKKENIDGLVLDVRYNGGGSLHEAMDMIGIFIDEGPLMGQKQKDGKTIFLKDPNRGMIYSGPMALMVNGQSASASEILAASLQDYNRALIVGSNTYGKATMQQMMVLDTATNTPTRLGHAKDIVKVTVGKLYRLSGETAQKNGVSPDIVLPDAFDGLDYREKFSPFVLPSDQVEKNAYYKPLTALPVSEIAKKSAERTSTNREFQDTRKMNEVTRVRRVKTETIPLNADSFEQWIKPGKQQMVDLKDNAVTADKKFIADNHGLDKALLANNSYAKELNSGWLLNIEEDGYIRETYLILCDLINLQQPKN